MSSTQSAYDILMTKVSFAEEQLDSILKVLEGNSLERNGPLVASVGLQERLKGLHNELSSALREARRVHMIELQTSGETRSKPISKNILSLIEENASLTAQSIEILASRIEKLETPNQVKSEVEEEEEDEPFHHNADGSCLYCNNKFLR